MTKKNLKALIDGLPERILSIFEDNLEDALEDYSDNRTLKPKAKKNHIGIEIECFSDKTNFDCMFLLAKHKLQKYVQIGKDGSIDTYLNEYEFRVLIPENELKLVFKRLGKFLKEGKFKVNDSCGLHVHLDMRNRDVEACYKKLVKFQNIMFGLVDKDRWENDYCKWTPSHYNPTDRFYAVNRQAYASHQTIEIRLHHGTVDIKKIENWVNLLIKALNDKKPAEVKSKEDVLKWAGKSKKLKQYIQKEFDPNSFSLINQLDMEA